MIKKIKEKFFTIFVFTFLFSSSLFCANAEFDSQYAMTITRCHGLVLPDILSDDWVGIRFIWFDNGLYGTSRLKWMHEALAKYFADMKEEGMVNIIFNKYPGHNNEYFAMVYNDSLYNNSIELKIHKQFLPKNLPQILSITENVEVITHWFSEEYKYCYVIELNDGTIWRTKSVSKPWEKPWDVGSRVIKIGNSRIPILINVEAVSDMETITFSKSREVEKLN